MARSLFCLVLGVLTGVVLAESLRWVREQGETTDYETLTDTLADKLDSLERDLPSAVVQ